MSEPTSDTVLHPRFLGFRISPLNARRLVNFRRNKRGHWSLWLFLFLFLGTLPAEFIANDRPLAIWYQGSLYTPVLNTYAETVFGGDFETEAAYREIEVQAVSATRSSPRLVEALVSLHNSLSQPEAALGVLQAAHP